MHLCLTKPACHPVIYMQDKVGVRARLGVYRHDQNERHDPTR